MHRTQVRDSDVTRQDKEKLVGVGFNSTSAEG